VWKSMRFQSSIWIGCRAKFVMNSCRIVSRMIAAATAAGGMAGIAAAGGIAAARRIAAGIIAGGLLDLRRAMTGGRARTMPL